MPLFMDFHIISDVTIDEVKRAHVADKAVQEKYNVKYHQFWVNEEAGTVFCLMEGPDMESCEATHREAHGNVACKIVEVEPGFYSLFMGQEHQVDHGLVRDQDGKVDLGYRFVLVVDIRGNTLITDSTNYRALELPERPKKLTLKKIYKFKGKEIKLLNDDSIVAVFMDSSDVLACAVELHNEFLRKSENNNGTEWDVSFKMGISGGQPLTENNGFFENVIKAGRRLSLIAGNREILISNLVRKLSDFQAIWGSNRPVRVIDPTEEQFLDILFDITENKLGDNNFNVESLSRDIGVSRPQLYRKITSITGRSPNSFIRDMKMQKALSLIREKQYNISEVALEVGFQNPSYFSKCFQKTYGITPSKVTA